MSSNPVIKAEGLSKTYRLFKRPQDRLLQSIVGKRKTYYEEVHALKNVSFTIHQGETVGIVGCNGSGKSTLLQMICGTVTPTLGVCSAKGRISALLELGAGFNPEFTGKENVFLNGAILGMSQEEIREKFPAIESFSGIGSMIDQPVKTYSSGMYVRLAFAVAIASDPDILIVDEALAVGDEAFQRKCFARIRAIQERGGTILFVSHSANTVIDVCNRAFLLDKGELLYAGTPKAVIANYNKLTYAPRERVTSLREELKQISQCPNTFVDKEGDNTSDINNDCFDPLMTPESKIVYEVNGAEITSPQLTTLEGEPVNLLNHGERYNYTYDVLFHRPVTDARFGMMLKTKSGLPLGGGTCAIGDHCEEIHAGQKIRVHFTFTCLLLPGTYFTNAGCTGVINGDRVSLHRMVDASMFKVLPGDNRAATGTVDFLMQAQTEIVQENSVLIVKASA